MRQKTQYDEWKSNDRVGDELLSQHPATATKKSEIQPPRSHVCRWTTRVIENRRACDICGEPEPKEEKR